jgi:AcrR family transcriptional regulator
MAERSNTGERRGRDRKLTPDGILEAALRIADDEGIESLSMRRLGQALGVEAMSLYKHVDGKEAILDGIAELVMREVEAPDRARPWRDAIRLSSSSMHRALLRHPWASAVIESRRNAGPARLGYLDAVVSMLIEAGFSIPAVARSFMYLDSYIYGYTMQVLAWPFDLRDLPPDQAAGFAAQLGTAYPGLAAMAELYATGAGVPLAFEDGLESVLDALERERAERPSVPLVQQRERRQHARPR